MSDISIQKDHTLGIEKARQLAQEWIDTAAKQLGLQCKCEQGSEQDTVKFERAGVSGTMLVSGTSFSLDVDLNIMMKAFKPLVEAEVDKNLTRIIEKASAA